MKINSSIAVFNADENGHVLIQAATLADGIFDIELTVDNENIASVSTSGYSGTGDGQTGRIIDPTGNNGPRSFRVWNNPEHTRQDRFYITFLNPTANARIFAAFSTAKP